MSVGAAHNSEAKANEREYDVSFPDAERAEIFGALNTVAWSAASPRGVCDEAARAIAERFCSPMVVVSFGGGDELVSVAPDEAHDRWRGVVDAEMLNAMARERSTARVFGDAQESPRFAVCASPITNGNGTVVGWLGVVVSCSTRAQAEAGSCEVRAIAAHLGNVMSISQTRPGRDGTEAEFSRMISKAGECKDLHEFAYAVTNALRGKIGAEQVAFGLVRGQGVRVVCISGQSEVKKRTPGVHRIRQAMEECLDRKTRVVFQEGGDWSAADNTPGCRLHEQWRSVSGSGGVASLPLRLGERIVGIVSLRMPGGDSVADSMMQAIERMLAPAGSCVPLLARASMGVSERAARRAAEVARWAKDPKSIGSKLLAGVAIALAAWFLFGRMEYRVSAPTILRASESRDVCAPWQGRLSHAPVLPGERFSAGDVLLEFDRAELELAHREALAGLARAEVELTLATQEGGPGAIAVSRAERNVAQARVEAACHRLEQAVVRAPYDGIVLMGDLSTRTGQVVPAGEPLLSIAAVKGGRAEVLVPEDSVEDVVPGAAASFTSKVDPDARHSFLIERVSVSPESRLGRRVVVAEGHITGNVGERGLLAGAEGVTRVSCGRRAVWWVALHRVIDGFNMRFWPKG